MVMEEIMESIWTQTCEIDQRKTLPGHIETEIAVIGAGMAGILTAYQLQKAGKQVVVLEGNRIASGQTRNTTAKITSQHGMIYHSMIKSMGEDKARQYAMANELALEEYRRIIINEHIDCDFEEVSSYVYSPDQEKLKAETEAAVRLGLPASFVKRITVSIAAAGAVQFENQGQFHPLKFLRAVSEPLEIYENTKVQTVEGSIITTDQGTVHAKQIVFACHYPFINFPGLYFARMHQERSYVLALEHAGQVDGVYIGEGTHSYSLRNYQNLLLFGGANHRTGENEQGGHYDTLRKKARELFPDCREVAHWSAQDCMPADGIPYIGLYAGSRPDWYVATGFGKWGMSSSMVAAMLIRDHICGKENSCAEVFDSCRFTAESLPQIACDSGHAVKGLTRRVFKIPEETIRELPPGHGGVVQLDGEKAGVYKDENGDLYTVDVRCPHLGCQLEWNPDELSWDCPCHGSRFDYQGHLISNPAQEDIGT